MEADWRYGFSPPIEPLAACACWADMNLLSSFDGLLWLLAALIVLVFLQRSLHREIQAFFLILSHNPGFTQVIFAIIFFPGVFLHELSHFLVAKLLGVQTGKFSLIPQRINSLYS